jgi:import receptor subunit TOM22
MITNVCFIFVFQDLDETLPERLWGLTEMFPEGVRNITSTVVSSTCTGIKGFVIFHFQWLIVLFQATVL